MTKKWQWNYRFISASVLMSGLGISIFSFCFEPHFRFNFSRSLPYTLFLTLPAEAPLDKGKMVSFHHSQLNVSVGKIIAGKAGDLISLQNQTLFLNDTEIGYVKTESKSGKIYHPISEGIIPEGFYFVYTPHPESFDSRYAEFGLIPEEWIEEVLWPLF